MDFKHKIVYYGKENHSGNCVPATEKERKAFISHFYSKGIKRCTFRELKQYVDFHGVRIEGRIYATINITDKYIYRDLLEKSEDLQESIAMLSQEARVKTNESEIKRKMKMVTKNLLKSILKTMQEQIDNVYNF